MRIEDINIRQVLTRNLHKTLEVEIKTKKGIFHSIAPIYKNGIYRMHCLHAERMTKKFLEIKRHFLNETFSDANELDGFMRRIDISVDFREIGANLAFAISSAFLKSIAHWEGLTVHQYLQKDKTEMPVPLCVVADKKKNDIDFKELMLYPVQQKGFSENLMKIADIYGKLDGINSNKLTNDKILRLISNVTTKNLLQIGVNFGAGKIWNDRVYTYSTGENLKGQEQLLLVQDIMKNYPVGYIEDPFHEDDFVLFSTLTHRLPTRIVSGNELYSNNHERFKRGIEIKASNGITISPSKAGTITDMMDMVKDAKKHKIKTIISEKDGDNFTSNLAVGLKFDYIKLRMENSSVNTINELIRIENKL